MPIVMYHHATHNTCYVQVCILEDQLVMNFLPRFRILLVQATVMIVVAKVAAVRNMYVVDIPPFSRESQCTVCEVLSMRL